MSVRDTLLFFRKIFGLSQEEVFPDKPRSMYTKIESEKQQLRVKDIQEISARYEISISEFFTVYGQFDEDSVWAGIINSTFDNSVSPEQKKENKEKIIDYFNQIKGKKHKSINELRYYYGIKNMFSKLWEEIDPYTEEDLNFAFDYLSTRKYHGYSHYTILMNISTHLKDDKLSEITNIMYPVKYFEYRDHKTRNTTSTIFLNMITAKLYSKEYKKAQEYIDRAHLMDKQNMNYYLKLSLLYLQNLLNYLLTNEIKYYSEIINFVKLVESIGDTQTANQIKEEIEILTNKNPNKNSDIVTNLIKDN